MSTSFNGVYIPPYANDITIYYDARMKRKGVIEYIDIVDIKINCQEISEYLYSYLKKEFNDKWVNEITKIIETDEKEY